MKAVFKRDLRAYFTSPLGYVYLAIFVLVTNLIFWLENMAQMRADLSGVFSFAFFALIFTTPLITMRIVSEDLKQKTDQLLFTAPMPLRSIVLGKFFSALSMFVLVLLLMLVQPFVVSLYGAVNVGALLGNYIAILCVAAAYIAIGLFVSALTENQLIAAVGALGIYLVLYVLEALSGVIPVGWIRTVFSWVSLSGRYTSIQQGLFSLSDIVYYISVCALFLFLAVRVLEKKRWA